MSGWMKKKQRGIWLLILFAVLYGALGFTLPSARQTKTFVYAGTFLLAAGVFWLAQRRDSRWGCKECWPEAAEAAAEAYARAQEHVVRLVDEIHFAVSISRCSKCNQHFISMFTETMDPNWERGNDMQFETAMPLRKKEVSALLSKPFSVHRVARMAPKRRSLNVDMRYEGGECLKKECWGKGFSTILLHEAY